MKIKQYDLGRWFGLYYTELQNSLSIVGLFSSLVGLTVLWAVASTSIIYWVPWLTYPLFMGIVFFVVLFILPVVHYSFLYKTQQRFQSEQGYKHDNPFTRDMQQVKRDMAKIKAKLGITDDEGN